MKSLGVNGKSWKVLTFLLFLILPSLLLVLAPFTIEDAYITFRYSRNFAEGLGPVYNPGERVEGYTAPLWMVLMVIPHLLGLKIELFAAILGIFCSAATAFLWMKMLSLQFAQRGIAFVVSLLILTQSTLLAFSISGMEMAQNLLVITLLIFQMTRMGTRPYQLQDALLMGSLLFLCVVSRPDNVVLLPALLIVAIWEGKTGKFLEIGKKFAGAMLILVPLLLLLAIWKISYYGDLLPNTFYAKEGGSFRQGIQYLGLFMISSGLPIAWLLGVIFLAIRRSFNDPLKKLSLIFPPLWMLYISLVGGDFMEFRMMAPVIPCMIFLAVKGISEGIQKPSTPWIVSGVLVAANIFLTTALYQWYYPGFIVTVPRLANETGNSGHGNILQGKKLKQLFGNDPDLRIASGGAGAMPYYAECYTLDMVGLNDPEIGRAGIVTQGIPGHKRFARLETLMEREINLVLGVWYLRNDTGTICTADQPELLGMLALETPLPEGIRLLSLPLGEGWEQRVIYLQPHEAVEWEIRAGNLREILIIR